MIASKHPDWLILRSAAVAVCLFGVYVANPTASVAQSKPATKASHDPLDEPYYWKIGGPDGKGNVLFANWDHRADIYLLSDYGFMLINAGSYHHPKPIYLVGDLKRRKVTAYISISSLQRALLKIPRGMRVPRYNVCTSGTASGVKARTWDSVERAFKKAHLKYDADNDQVMYDVCGEGADPLPDAAPNMKAAYVRVYGKAAYEKHALHH